MPAHLENSAVATGLEKVSFHSNPKERQCQRMFRLPHNCTHLTYWQVKVKVAQSGLTLCNPMDYTVHGILQARILEWVAIPFSRRSFQPRDQTQVSCIAGRFFTTWATRETRIHSETACQPRTAHLRNSTWEKENEILSWVNHCDLGFSNTMETNPRNVQQVTNCHM